ncbi:5-bromo-4-chloroindolyl phosphate hydrolysis family protein [Eubacteriales bacterium OttesenSCG-928-A19]|nr:5-bromo-4-chloroindolyl phosphate hydrolysis family protein [Eubacteriales bacterium OttesenSCG-928-A19]
MKTVSQQETVFPYKVIRKPSPMPYLFAGVIFLLYGILRPIAGVLSYIIGAALAVGAYFLGRGIWPDQKIKVELPPDTGDINTNQLLTEARQQLAAIRAANDKIADPTVSKTIDNIEATCLKILARLEEDPGLYSQLRTFLRYYLPTTRKLLDSRAAIEQGGTQGENAQQVSARTDRVLPEIESAFERQLEAMDKHKYLDIQVEMDVLEGMLKSDGLNTGDSAQGAPNTSQS